VFLILPYPITNGTHRARTDCSRDRRRLQQKRLEADQRSAAEPSRAAVAEQKIVEANTDAAVGIVVGRLPRVAAAAGIVGELAAAAVGIAVQRAAAAVAGIVVERSVAAVAGIVAKRAAAAAGIAKELAATAGIVVEAAAAVGIARELAATAHIEELVAGSGFVDGCFVGGCFAVIPESESFESHAKLRKLAHMTRNLLQYLVQSPQQKLQQRCSSQV